MSGIWINPRTRVWTAQMCGDSSAMGHGASRVMSSVRSVAARHVATGAYMSKLRVVQVPGEQGTGRSVKDLLVVADDEGAAAIEWGHIHRVPGSRRVKWIPGQHIMSKGLAGVKAVD